MPKGYIFITRPGYDPEKGKHIKDPYLGDVPTLGACQPQIRRGVDVGDHIFAVTGSLRNHNQFIFGGFEVAQKIDAFTAYKKFPHLRLRELKDGQLTGNIIIDANGDKHPLDNHSNFERRLKNYIIGKNPIALTKPIEFEQAREETLDTLQRIIGKNGDKPINIIGRCSKLSYNQVLELRHWLMSIKKWG